VFDLLTIKELRGWRSLSMVAPTHTCSLRTGAKLSSMLDAYRIQASAGPVTDKPLEKIVFRAAHGVEQSLAP
jgi:hypothetical protein